MIRTAILWVAVGALLVGPAIAGEPDTLLIFKNGTEVKGHLLGMDNGEYSLELADGRRMTYPAADVDQMKRLASESPGTASTPTTKATLGTPLAELCRGTTLFTEYALASDLYEPIKEIEVAQKGMGYGSGTKYYPDLAAKAKEVGGDAVISVKEWRGVTAWSWSAPHVGGLAVRWTEKAKSEVVKIENKCL